MLNNEDKKYLKDTVEKKLDNLDKKIDKGVNGAKGASNPNSEIGKKLNDLYKQNQDREDREKLIEELQKKVNSGEATLAQKIELINQNLQKKIPDDVRDAWKMTAAEMKTGGKQAAKGIDSLITKIASVNPMLAMLYASSKDITKAAWDITAGTAKFGVGLAKGAAGILNSAVNMFKKKEEKEETPEEETPKQEEQGRISIEGKTVEEYEDEEKSTAEKINEMHEWIFNKFPKMKDAEAGEEKKKQSILAKGLGGLGKSMQAVNKVIEFIAVKQKLILGGIMLGAVGILALVGWIANGGLEDLWNKLNPANNHNNDNKSRNELLSKNVISSPYSGKELKQMFNDQSKNMTNLTGGNITYDKNNGKYNRHTGKTSYIDNVKATYDNGEKGKLAPVLAPFDGECTSFKLLTEIKNGDATDRRFEISIKPLKKDNISYTQGKKQGGLGSWELQELIIENLIEPQVSKGDKFSKGYPLGFSDGSVTFRAASGAQSGEAEKAILEHYLQDYSKQIDEAKADNYAGNFEILAKEKTADRGDKLQKDIIKASRDSNAVLNKGVWNDVLDIRDWASYTVDWDGEQDKVKGQIFDSNDTFNAERTDNSVSVVKTQPDDLSGEPNASTRPVPVTDTNQSNTTDNKVTTQQTQLRNLQLKELDLSDKERSTLVNDDKKGNNIIALNNEQSTQSQPSETFNAAQYYAATEA